jgi:poly-gamma-glutamate capsule biosynthesis protein CapA/YwtB (metallophosphatase superfamily)
MVKWGLMTLRIGCLAVGALLLTSFSVQAAEVVFLATGDIMLGRLVAARTEATQNPLLPFQGMSQLLESSNFNFGNLECTFTPPKDYKSDSKVVANDSGGGTTDAHTLALAAPRENIQGLIKYNFKVLNLANNHAFDQGLDGLLYTIAYLDSNHIQHFGTGPTLEDAWQPAVVETQGVKICFLGASYSSVNDLGQIKNNYVARIEDIDHLKSSLIKAKSECNFTVVSMHAGQQYTLNPISNQIAFAHSAIDNGADMVIGAHPHWIQTIEKYQGKYIFYSLGNYIFNMNISPETKEGLVLKIKLTTEDSNKPAKLQSIELIPIIIENNYAPRVANEEEAKSILEKIGQTEKVIYP